MKLIPGPVLLEQHSQVGQDLKQRVPSPSLEQSAYWTELDEALEFAARETRYVWVWGGRGI